MRILGIDPGSRVLGYAAIDVGARTHPLGGLGYVECGVIVAARREPMEARLAELARGLREVIEELSPDVVAAEDVFAAANFRSALALGHARGMVLAVAGLADLRVYSYPPAVIKQAVTGRGRAPKEQVALMVRTLVGLRRLPRPDAADALAVAVAHAHIRKDVATARGAATPMPTPNRRRAVSG
jgi:crossover junction endodeoxyribonuclease RuvC